MILAMRLPMRARRRRSEPLGRARRNISRICAAVSKEASRLGRSARDEEAGRARGEGQDAENWRVPFDTRVVGLVR